MPVVRTRASCSRSEAFIPEATTQIEGLSAIISKEWMEEAESCEKVVRIYHDYRILLCAIKGTDTQQTVYDPKIGVNIISSSLASRIRPDEP